MPSWAMWSDAPVDENADLINLALTEPTHTRSRLRPGPARCPKL